jgi:hypothetical protein
LQPAGFSCRDAPDFNRAITQMTSNDALFENPVNAQWELSPRFRHVFAVVNLGTRPYCGEAPRNETTNPATKSIDSFNNFDSQTSKIATSRRRSFSSNLS